MSEYKIIKTFEGDKLFENYKKAEACMEYLTNLCKQQSLAITPLKLDIDDYHGGHRYTSGYEVVLDCENEINYSVVMLLL